MGVVYKTEEGRQVFKKHYQNAIDALPFQLDMEMVDTKFGKTNVASSQNKGQNPLWMFHGVGVNAPMAFQAAPRLVHNHQVFVPDVIGQTGRTEEVRLNIKDDSFAIWAKQLMENYHNEPVPLIGVSYGAFIAMRLAKYFPEKISKLILVVPSGLMNSNPWASFTKVGWPMMRYKMSPNKKNLDRILNNIFSTPGEWSEFQQDLFKHFNMDMRIPPLSKKKDMSYLKAPVYVIGAEEDIFFPGNQVIYEARSIFPNFQKGHLLRGIKHAPPLDHSELNDVLNKYLAE